MAFLHVRVFARCAKNAERLPETQRVSADAVGQELRLVLRLFRRLGERVLQQAVDAGA